jgi:hypothetical protein
MKDRTSGKNVIPGTIKFRLALLRKFQKYGLALILVFALINKIHAQGVDSSIVIHEKPENLLKRLNIQNITQNGFNFWKDEFTGHWAGIDAGLNVFTNTDYSGYDSEFLQGELLRSNSLFVNPVQQSIGLQRNKNTLGLVTGLGLEWKSYMLNKSTTLEKLESGYITPRTLVFDDNQKSRFSMFYLTFPLLFEIQIPVNNYKNRAFVSLGFLGAVRLNSFTKISYRLDRKREKLKTPGDYSLHNFRYSLSLRAGYRDFQLFGNFDLHPLFKNDLGPKVTPVTFGITLLSF